MERILCTYLETCTRQRSNQTIILFKIYFEPNFCHPHTAVTTIVGGRLKFTNLLFSITLKGNIAFQIQYTMPKVIHTFN